MAHYASMLVAAAFDSTNPLVDYGLLGIILVAAMTLIVTTTFVPGKLYWSLQKENEELRRALPDLMRATIEATAASQEMVHVARDVLVAMQVSNARQGHGP